MFCSVRLAVVQAPPPSRYGSVIVSIRLQEMWGLDSHLCRRSFDPQGHLGANPYLIWTVLALRLLGCHSATIGGTGMLSCRLTFVYVPRIAWPVPVRFTRLGYAVLASLTHGGLFICLLIVYMSVCVSYIRTILLAVE